jgi:hypothetical protein
MVLSEVVSMWCVLQKATATGARILCNTAHLWQHAVTWNTATAGITPTHFNSFLLRHEPRQVWHTLHGIALHSAIVPFHATRTYARHQSCAQSFAHLELFEGVNARIVQLAVLANNISPSALHISFAPNVAARSCSLLPIPSHISQPLH